MQRHQLMLPDIDYALRPGQRETCFPSGSLGHLQRSAAQSEYPQENSREVQS